MQNAPSEFFSAVLARLDAEDAGDSSLGTQWKLVQASRRNPDEALFCEAAGAPGLDPCAIPDENAAFVEESGTLFDGEPLFEFLAGLRPPAGGLTRAGSGVSVRGLPSTNPRALP